MLEINEEMKTAFAERIGEKLGPLISTTIQHSLGKALGEIYTKIPPTKRLMDLKYLILDNI